MAFRRFKRYSRRKVVAGRPNLIWVSTAGFISLVRDTTTGEKILMPSDWSGTVTETQATLERLVLSMYTNTQSFAGTAHAQNYAIVKHSNVLSSPGHSSADISQYPQWPDYFEQFDSILHIGRLEWDGTIETAGYSLKVQFSQLPDPMVNLRCKRNLTGDEAIGLAVGGAWDMSYSDNSAPYVTWFCRSLVKIGLR